MRFNPPLPYEKQEAIRKIGFGTLDKIFLQMTEAQREVIEKRVGKLRAMDFLWNKDVDYNDLANTWV